MASESDGNSLTLPTLLTLNKSRLSEANCPFGGRDPYTEVLVTLDVSIAILAFFGNSILLRLIWRHVTLHTVNNLFISALAVSDLLVAFNIPFYVTFYFDVTYRCDRFWCMVRYFCALYVTLLSVVLMIGVAVDRYFSVVHPLQYKAIMHCDRAKRIIAFTYIYVMLIVVIPGVYSLKWEQPRECDLVHIFNFAYVFLVVVAHVAITAITTFFLYAKVFAVAFNQVRQRKENNQSNTDTSLLHQSRKLRRKGSCPDLSPPQDTSAFCDRHRDGLPHPHSMEMLILGKSLTRHLSLESQESKKNNKTYIFDKGKLSKSIVHKMYMVQMEAKTAQTMAILLVTHLLCLIPFLIVTTWGYMEAHKELASQFSVAKKFVVVLYFGKSCLNPIVYGWKNRELRSAFLNDLKNLKSKCSPRAQLI